LDDQYGRVREATADALAGRDGWDVTDALLARSKHSNEDMLRIEMAAQRGGRDVTDGLLARLHDADDKKVHHTVMRALAGRDGQDVTDALLARLDDQDWLVREAAARALGGRESQDVTAALLACSNDANKDVREAAAEAISRQTSPADLLMLALHAWPDTVPAELLDAAYTLTTHHYQALPFRDQQMIRARMSRLTLAPSLRS
jgi:HEAT repeat protein